MSRGTYPRATHNTVSEGSVSLVTLISFLHGHYVAGLALGHSCSFDINFDMLFQQCYASCYSVRVDVFCCVFCILFAGALGLMCQHGGQGVNDWGNDIYM